MSYPHVEKLTTHFDSRGDLTELIHGYDLVTRPVSADPEYPVEVPKFGQIYVVHSEQAGIIRAFHRHKTLWDYFIAVSGKARVWCVRGDGVEAFEYILSSKHMSRLTVPPEWWHGWVSLVPDTILVCVGSEVYNKDNPDEERVPFDKFAEVTWEVEPK